MRTVEATKLWKRLFGLKKFDRVKIVGGADRLLGAEGVVIYLYPRDHRLRYLVRLDNHSGLKPCRDEEVEWIPNEEG